MLHPFLGWTERDAEWTNRIRKRTRCQSGRECTVLQGRSLPELSLLLDNTHKSIICGLFIASVYFCSDKTADICQGKFFAEIFVAENEALLTQGQDDKVKSAEKACQMRI